jgi:hypothetical protein
MTVSASRTSSGVAVHQVTKGPASLGMAIVCVWGLTVQYGAQGIGGALGHFGLHHGFGRMVS